MKNLVYNMAIILSLIQAIGKINEGKVSWGIDNLFIAILVLTLYLKEVKK
jgi:hypothetical protein